MKGTQLFIIAALTFFISCTSEKTKEVINEQVPVTTNPTPLPVENKGLTYIGKWGGFDFVLNPESEKFNVNAKGLGYGDGEPNYEIMGGHGVITFKPTKIEAGKEIGKILSDNYSKQDDFSAEPSPEKLGDNEVYFYKAVKLSSSPTDIGVIKVSDKHMLVIFYQSPTTKKDSVGDKELRKLLETLVIVKK